MIEIIEGRGVGAGKSYYVVTRVIKHVVAGGTVYYSDTLELLPDKIAEYVERKWGLVLEKDQMVPVSRDEVWRIHEVTPPGTDELPVLIILDEVQRALNARDWADKSKRALFDWACESRHDSNDLIFISQNALNIDKQVARLATYITRVRNMAGFKLGGFAWPFKQFLIHILDGDGKTSIDKKLIWQDKAIFSCYRSKSMRGAHKRLFADAIPKRKLQKVKKSKMKFLLIIFACLVLGGGCLGWKVYQNGLPGFGKTVAAVPSPSQPGRKEKAAEGGKPAWETIRETFRASSGGLLRTAESGEYEVGVMSINGFVEQIKGRVVKCRAADGRTVYVLAQDAGPQVALAGLQSGTKK